VVVDRTPTELWADRVYSSTYASTLALGFTQDGSVCDAGSFHEGLDVDDDGTADAQAVGEGDAFLGRADPSGARRYLLPAGAPGDDAVYAAVALPGGDCAYAGTVTGPIDLGAGVIDGAAGVLVARVGVDGTPVWVRLLGGGGIAIALAGSNGLLHVAGFFVGPWAPDPTFPLPHWGGLDGFVLTLGPDGSVLRAWAFGGPGDDYAAGVAEAADGSLIVAASFEGTINVGGTVLQAVDGADVLLLRLR
jgi:hypothetical protein